MAITTAHEYMMLARPIGRLPEPGDRLPAVRVKQARARVVDNSFFWRDKTRPAVGEVIIGDHDDVVGLARRGLVQELA